MSDVADDRVRAFLQIQNGCNHRCTFCIIPYARGNSRSVPLGEIILNTVNLVEKGFKEVVITGVDITGYGADLPGSPSFTQMIRRLLNNVPKLPRLRLSSVDVAELSDEFIELFVSEKRIMPYLHLSMQSGDDMILKRMKRRHNTSQVLAFLDRIKKLRPETSFGADIIAGFPTETDAMFQNTMNLLDKTGIANLHVFPYSQREGTPAARMPQVPHNIRKARANQIRELGKKNLLKENVQKIGKTLNVLVEGDSSYGRAEDFSKVKFIENNINLTPGDIVSCFTENAIDDYLVGRPSLR